MRIEVHDEIFGDQEKSKEDSKQKSKQKKQRISQRKSERTWKPTEASVQEAGLGWIGDRGAACQENNDNINSRI